MNSTELLNELHETKEATRKLQHQIHALSRKARELGARYNQALIDEAEARRAERQQAKDEITKALMAEGGKKQKIIIRHYEEYSPNCSVYKLLKDFEIYNKGIIGHILKEVEK